MSVIDMCPSEEVAVIPILGCTACEAFFDESRFGFSVLVDAGDCAVSVAWVVEGKSDCAAHVKVRPRAMAKEVSLILRYKAVG